ncbi:hypothetical protein DFH08DRAFT_802275 [Mycena albidolilacea]|uniref:Uncharacterized protein n=1 Tax=Mycena albidolilacea TaxID=1033008 RepID=A0AAD7AH36_9AGAR|nr:hypothetical protein DFH08DRAFT_802275 [Mycena albidolilacea]
MHYPTSPIFKTQNWEGAFEFRYSLSIGNSGRVPDMKRRQKLGSAGERIKQNRQWIERVGVTKLRWDCGRKQWCPGVNIERTRRTDTGGGQGALRAKLSAAGAKCDLEQEKRKERYRETPQSASRQFRANRPCKSGGSRGALGRNGLAKRPRVPKTPLNMRRKYAKRISRAIGEYEVQKGGWRRGGVQAAEGPAESGEQAGNRIGKACFGGAAGPKQRPQGRSAGGDSERYLPNRELQPRTLLLSSLVEGSPSHDAARGCHCKTWPYVSAQLQPFPCAIPARIRLINITQANATNPRILEAPKTGRAGHGLHSMRYLKVPLRYCRFPSRALRRTRICVAYIPLGTVNTLRPRYMSERITPIRIRRIRVYAPDFSADLMVLSRHLRSLLMPRTPAPAESSSTGTRISGRARNNARHLRTKRKMNRVTLQHRKMPVLPKCASIVPTSPVTTPILMIRISLVAMTTLPMRLEILTLKWRLQMPREGQDIGTVQAWKSNKRARHQSPMRGDPNDSPVVLILDAPSSNQPSSSPKTKKRSKTRRNAIHHFFEEVDDDGTTPEPGTRYYKCYLGRHKILKITKKMNNSITVHNRLYQVLNGRSKSPTLVVVKARLRWARAAIIELLGGEWSRN